MDNSNGVPPPRGTGIAFVTGAGGFIGRHVVSMLSDAGWQVAGFGRQRPAPDPALGLSDAQHWIGGSLSREGLLRAAAEIGRPELVVHAAGAATVGASFLDPAADHVWNVGTTQIVLEFLREAASEARLVFLSSAAVYGTIDLDSIAENSPTAPISPYGIHKLEAERLIHAAADDEGLDAAIVRFFSVYGPGNRKQLLWDIATRLALNPHRLDLSGTGEEVRDFLYVDAAVRMIGLLAGSERRASPLVVNCGSGIPTSVRELAEDLCRALQIETEIVFDGVVRTGDPRRQVSDQAEARRLGLVRTIPLAEGLDRFAHWARMAIAFGPS